MSTVTEIDTRSSPLPSRPAAWCEELRTVAVVGTPQASWPLTRVDDIRRIRHLAAAEVGRWGTGVDMDSLELVLSELATNAVLHGRLPATVRVRRAGSRVLLSVADASSSTPAVPEEDLRRVGGLGLRICAALCASVTVTHRHGGKVVNAVLAPDREGPSPAVSRDRARP